MFFIISKVLSILTYPFSWILIALVIAWFTKRPRLSRYTFRGAIITAFIFSNTVLFLEFVRAWEPDGKKIEETGHYDCAIVLGGMAEWDNSNERLSLRRGGDRIWQTVHLYHLGKVDKILISGSNGYLRDDGLNEAVQFKTVLVEMGIPEEDIWVESTSKNTYQNAIESKKIIDQHSEIKSILLVTSALHMRRAQSCFEKAGFEDFDTFPTDHYTGNVRGYTLEQVLMPDSGTLVDWHKLIHEWIGYVSYKLMGYL